MNFDPNGYPIPEPNAPRTALGAIAWFTPFLVLIALAAYGAWQLAHLFLN